MAELGWSEVTFSLVPESSSHRAERRRIDDPSRRHADSSVGDICALPPKRSLAIASVA